MHLIFQEFNSRLANAFKVLGINFCETKEHIFFQHVMILTF